MNFVDKYKEVIACSNIYNAHNVNMAPSLFYDRVGFFVVATTTFPDMEINDALAAFSKLCMSYELAKKEKPTATVSEIMSNAEVLSANAAITFPEKPCCGGGQIR